jgi:hypothetical protein
VDRLHEPAADDRRDDGGLAEDGGDVLGEEVERVVGVERVVERVGGGREGRHAVEGSGDTGRSRAAVRP